ncbi:unnamed protein product [Paramecium pentaurelia]|uniref:Tetratricopeptide repeat protein n=1 Tax=Paramecium pentaurelia TaxID=43138 RepID=A0A8S1YMZ1_9CILI|nr:unnamed protein product [Paramecium pentaurelia]
MLLCFLTEVNHFVKQSRNVFYEKGENEKALQDHNMAILLNPNNAEAHMNRGVLFDKIGEKEKARQGYQKALLLQSDYPLIVTNLGSLYFKQKQFSQANIYFTKAQESLDSINQQQISKWNLSNSNLTYIKIELNLLREIQIRYKQQMFKLIIYLNNYKDRNLFNQRNKPRNQQMNLHNKQSHQILNQIQINIQSTFRFWNNLKKVQ